MQPRWLSRGLIVRTGIFLLLGAIINVAVAWSCVCCSETEWLPPSSARYSPWRASVPRGWPKRAILWDEERGVGLNARYLSAYDDPEKQSDRYVQWTFEAGLPFRSLMIEKHRKELVGAEYGPLRPTYPFSADERQGFEIPGWVPVSPWTRWQRILPLRPRLLGFTANSITYASFLWLISGGPFALRRSIRIRRGHCPNCNYDLRATTTGICPECGAQV